MNLRFLVNLKNELFILCILILIQTSKQSNVKEGSCPEGFVDWYPNSEFCYLIRNEQVTWTEAREHCTGLGGNLPSVNSPEEQEVLKNNAFQQGANAWIGLRAENADSPWTWSDGSESTTRFWDEGEPNFGNPEVAYCAYINRNKDGRWDDNRCDDQQHEILCKIKKHEINAELISYWDNGDCGPYGDDYNWDWCGANSGEPCKEQVETDQCPSGTAKLKTVEGNQNAVSVEENYQLNDCWFTYYATYSCSESDQGHHCADEGQTCACYGNVKYGLEQTWTEEKVVEGSIQCTNEVFGDIVPGKKKECRCTPTNYKLVKSGVECTSADEHLGDLNNVWECANACQEISECKYFISGTGEKEGYCFWEKTESADCPEGWEDDLYDFYEMIRHVDEEKYWVDDGCPGTGTDYDGSFQPKSYQACVRCCSNEGPCVTPEKVQPCGEHKMSFDDATAICAEIDHRLCTKEELIGAGEQKGKCCGSGGSCDSEIVWTSTPENPEPEPTTTMEPPPPPEPKDYIVDCEKRNFQDSIDYCTSRGCTISSFHSDDDINSVKDRVTCKAYIGATSDGNGKWSYIDGTEWWAYSQNDGLDGIGETKIVWNDDGTGWHDWKTGEDPQGVICQQCQEQSTTTTAPPPPPPNLPCSEDSPDDGWVTTESTPDFCYYGVTQAKNWQGANEDCRNKGGYLTSIHSNEENDFVSSILPDSTFWIGLVKSQKGGQRHWSDNSPYDYDQWNEGEPNDSGNGEDCTESWGRNIADIGGKWNDLICSGTFVYICKKYKEGHEPTAPPPTETPSGHCYDDGSTSEFNHNCYKWLTRPEGYSWADAVKACDEVEVPEAAEHFHLASIHSERESAFIKTMYTYLPNENQNTIFWFGASDETTEGEWSYVDGSTFDYTHWEGNEPNNQGEEDCATLASGENHPSFWNDAPCSGTYGAFCKSTVNPNNENPPLLQTCENEGLPDFFRFNGACYKWMDVPKTWDEAEQDCKNQHSSHLVSIPTDMEQSYVFANAQQSQAWIGLSNKENKDIFKWSDGWEMTYQNWYPNQQPSNEENQCAYLDVNKFYCEESCGYPEGYWIASSCSETHPYMCKYGDVSPDTMKCPDNDWIHYGPSCYKAYSTYDDDLRSFTEARGFCQSQGGDLITLGSQEEEQTVLKQIVDGNMVSNIFWIGLHKSEGAQGESYEDDYEWVDGSLKEYNHFADSYPNSRNDIEKCIMADNDWGNQADEDARLRWKNYNCETRMEFVCEVPAGRDVPTTVQPPTLAPQVPCDPDNESDGWIKFPIDQGGNEEYCYFFSSVSPMGFLDARQNCQQQGGELASIHSAEENSFLMHNLGSNDVAWIGFLKDAPTDQFLWTDGSSPDFLGWGPGEPNDASDMESCAHLVTKTGTWNDEICYSNHNFVCKKPFNGTWPSPPPTTIPEGHCRADFNEFQGYCYKMLGFEGEDSKKDWNGAKDACNNFQVGKAYDLASIHNPREAAYVTTMLADLPNDVFTSFWIGANEGAATEGVWWWSDESRWDFDNWAQGQPDDWNSPFDCAVIRDRDVGNDVGKWDDIDCFEINGYICKTQASTEYNAPPATPKCDDVPEVADYKFTKFNGNCYKYQSSKVTWQEAENACQQMGGSHLVSINDAMEQAFAFTRIKSVSTWIGLNNKQSHELFKWSDGWRVSYTNWGMEDNTKEEACVQLNITTGKWDAMGCDLTLPYMCKFSTVQPPTPNPNGECPDKFQDLDSSSEYCYYISPDTDGKSWGDAHSECFAYEGTLASIHSEESNSRISDALKGRSKDVWIGLQADIHGTWNWVDETPFDYNNWHDGEPNHNDDFNYCAKIYEAVGDDYVGTWDDDLCNNLNGFICEKKRIPGPPPDTTPGKPTTTTSKPTGGPTTTTTSPSGLSSGAKAAVAICMLLLIAALVGGCVWFYFFMKQRNFEFNKLWNEYQVRAKLGKTNASTPSGFDNVAYVNNSEDSRIHNDILDSA